MENFCNIQQLSLLFIAIAFVVAVSVIVMFVSVAVVMTPSGTSGLAPNAPAQLSPYTFLWAWFHVSDPSKVYKIPSCYLQSGKS